MIYLFWLIKKENKVIKRESDNYGRKFWALELEKTEEKSTSIDPVIDWNLQFLCRNEVSIWINFNNLQFFCSFWVVLCENFEKK